MSAKKVLKAATNEELLSYIINVTPELSGEIDLPVQGQTIEPLGKIILNNQRYRNAFINTVNLIGLTVIKRNGWTNPWDFTNRGTLRFGQQVREIIADLCNVYDYNKLFNENTRFLESQVPNIFNYIHEINFQKFYQTTTSDAQMSMAFDSDDGLFDLIDSIISMLYESLVYDTYITNKYMLCRRILDGTVTPVQLINYSELTPRQRVSAIKSTSNKLSFRSPNYNPAGIRRATSFDDQILIVSTDFEADFSTDVLATSFFRDEADMRSRMVLIDGFDNHDKSRLNELLGDEFVEFTNDELSMLSTIPAVLVSREWFMDYDYIIDGESSEKMTEFYNPTTLTNNHFLHAWRVFSTSPFENAVVFTSELPSIESVTVNPATASITRGQSINFTAVVETNGFANKSVLWAVDNSSVKDGVKITMSGVLTVPVSSTVNTITVTATSIYDNTKTATATLTVS